jgi:glyoxylase-like metal-dependent hydrolase (beta-lactamase superfamily II)
MKINRLVLGEFQTNCYVVRQDDAATDCLIVDTGLEAAGLMRFLAQHELTPRAVVLTHGHVDHFVGIEAVRRDFPEVKVYIHKLDAPLLADPAANLSAFAGVPSTADPADVLLEDGDTLTEADVTLRVIHTPGHTPGGICLYAEAEGVLFAGDTLFADGVGRTDFPGGDSQQLVESIRTRLLGLPDETTVCPGHAMRTTIGREKAHNPFLV